MMSGVFPSINNELKSNNNEDDRLFSSPIYFFCNGVIGWGPSFLVLLRLPTGFRSTKLELSSLVTWTAIPSPVSMRRHHFSPPGLSGSLPVLEPNALTTTASLKPPKILSAQCMLNTVQLDPIPKVLSADCVTTSVLPQRYNHNSISAFLVYFLTQEMCTNWVKSVTTFNTSYAGH